MREQAAAGEGYGRSCSGDELLGEHQATSSESSVISSPVPPMITFGGEPRLGPKAVSRPLEQPPHPLTSACGVIVKLM